MALPRSWEVGDGLCDVVAPDSELLRRVKAGELAIREYLVAYAARMTGRVGLLRPGVLDFGVVGGVDGRTEVGRYLVADGDSLLCACAAPATDPLAALFALPDLSRHPCHLEVLAPFLALQGWSVRLYGVELEVVAGVVHRSGRPYTWEPL